MLELPEVITLSKQVNQVLAGKTILSAKTWRNPCPCCGAVVVKEAYLGGTVYYCPQCQRIE